MNGMPVQKPKSMKVTYTLENTAAVGENAFSKAWYLAFHKECCEKMIEITQQKNADYTGVGDDPFKNFKAVGFYSHDWILIGFFTRMTDKFGRLASFIQRGVLYVKNETIEDSLLDLANYCILLAGYIRSLKGSVTINGRKQTKTS